MNRRDFCLAMAATAAAGPAAASPAVARGLFASDAESVAVGVFPEFGGGITLFDYARNVAGALKPSGLGFDVLATLDARGSPIGALAPEEEGFHYRNRSWRAVRLDRKPFRLSASGVAISGEIITTAGRAPKGVVVLVYGSGDGRREGLDFWAMQFVSQELAVVVYDKRGCGESGGDWHASGFEALAADARAVVQHARAAYPKLRLGVWGISQAGWILPQVADAADFLVMHMGCVTTPLQQSLDEVEAELKAYEFPQDEIARAMAYYRLDRAVSCGTASWQDLITAAKAAEAAKAEWLIAAPLPADDAERKFFRLIADFDAAPFWRRCRTPILAVFGGRDIVVPPDKNAPALETLLPTPADATIRVLPAANHLGFLGKSGVRAEYAACSAVDPAYFPLVNGWMAQRL